MSILSIDVGMKNLAICVIDNKNDNHKILAWEVVDLCSTQGNTLCTYQLKSNALCNKSSKYTDNNKYYCKLHAKKCDTPIPPSNVTPKKIKKMKLCDLKNLDLFKNHNFKLKSKKVDIVNNLISDLSNNYLHIIEKVDSRTINCITYGIRLKKYFDKLLNTYTIETVIIENQIGPLALRMKMLQGMIMQHFIENNILNIKEISPSNKLKNYIPANKKTTYNDRKKLGIQITKDLLTTNKNIRDWEPYFNNHSKKDDLADSYLQVLWFIQQNN
tara:strand:+ start:896 stop:1711 length:816 start_codon:yes stop_codon:yes gene_type:complete